MLLASSCRVENQSHVKKYRFNVALTLAVPSPAWAAPLVNPPPQREAHSSAWKM